MAKEYRFDEDCVKAIIRWAESAQLPKDITLSVAERISNIAMYVRANINDIAHYPDEFYNPAITRLYRLKEFIEGAAE